jgi:archaellum component FlaG (FlaF/FlaG flagellin family)
MGFSTIGAGIVLFIGMLFVASSVLSATFEGQRSVLDASRDDRERERFDRETAAVITNAEREDGNNYRIYVKNTGGTTLDPYKVAVFLDGELQDPGEISRLVDGQATSVWAPGQELRLTKAGVTPGNEPDRVFLVLENGRGLVWTDETDE